VTPDCKTLLHQSHNSGELWGLATAPAGDSFVTAGDDKTLRVWDVRAHTETACSPMKGSMRAAAYSPDGLMIAVGFGANEDVESLESAAGGFCVVDAGTLEVIFEGQDSKEWIQDVKFSPDGATLAIFRTIARSTCMMLKVIFRRKQCARGTAVLSHTWISQQTAAICKVHVAGMNCCSGIVRLAPKSQAVLLI